ncbi:MAG: FMN-binding negative transcriptional regulator [Aquisalimonadaceae bacterium]
MYVPTHFAETRTGKLHAFIREHAFGALITTTTDGIEANHLPFALDTKPQPNGILRGHLARSNPAWRAALLHTEALVIFQGPDAYISPAWYPSKQAHGKVVPTWNYAVVHAYGRLRFIEDGDWLRRLVDDLTRQHEAGRAAPWNVSDAPAEYTAGMLRAIVGVELRITRLVGKWKMSQNRSAADRRGVIEGLLEENRNAATSVAHAMTPNEDGCA